MILQIAKHECFTTNVRFTVKRGQDLNTAAKILLFEYGGDLRETTKNMLDEFVSSSAREAKEKLELAGRRVVDILNDMTEIFLPRGDLLTSGGIFPVYYWLVRSRHEDDYPVLRKFLVRFQEERRRNRELSVANPKSGAIDRKLLNYDRYNRSTNDQ